jgi:hypothetical protein
MRDLIYLDVGKAASLLSQVEGGLLQEMRATDEASLDRKGGFSASIQILKAELGGTGSERTSRVETRILHHGLLNRLEEALAAEKLVVGVNHELASSTDDVQSIREAIARAPYLLAEGWAVIEDFERLKRRVENFNPLIELIAKSSRSQLENSDDFLAAKQELERKRQAVDALKDRNERHRERQTLKAMEAQLELLLSDASSQIGKIDDWLVDGIAQWVDSFNPGQLHLRIYPFEATPDFQILANLKRDCFVDADIEHLLFSYGTRPNVKLSMFGLISSLPSQRGPTFDPLAEFEEETNDLQGGEHLQIERAFRRAFSGLHGLEEFGRFDRFPNVTVQPIAVFRRIKA